MAATVTFEIPADVLESARMTVREAKIMQPVSLNSDTVWTEDFHEPVRRLRGGNLRPKGEK